MTPRREQTRIYTFANWLACWHKTLMNTVTENIIPPHIHDRHTHGHMVRRLKYWGNEHCDKCCCKASIIYSHPKLLIATALHADLITTAVYMLLALKYWYTQHCMSELSWIVLFTCHNSILHLGTWSLWALLKDTSPGSCRKGDIGMWMPSFGALRSKPQWVKILQVWNPDIPSTIIC